MFTKLSSKTLIALLFVAMPAAATKRELVVLTAPAHATVADLLSSSRDGQVSFNLPSVPQFTHRSWYQATPKGLHEYPAFFKTEGGLLTTAAMIRFMEQGHTLFTNEQEQAEYKEVVKNCIDAHKQWYQSEEMMDAIRFHLAEGKVLNFLKRLSLDTRETRHKLEKMLSTPIRTNSSTYNKLILPNRSWVAQSKTNEAVVKHSGFLPLATKQLLASVLCMVPGLTAAYLSKNTKSPLDNCAVFAAITWSVFETLDTIFDSKAAWKHDSKLTAEPGKGIKVVIELTYPETEDTK